MHERTKKDTNSCIDDIVCGATVDGDARGAEIGAAVKALGAGLVPRDGHASLCEVCLDAPDLGHLRWASWDAEHGLQHTTRCRVNCGVGCVGDDEIKRCAEMKNDKQLLYQVAVRAYWGESGELAYSVRVTPGSVEVYAVSLCETESDALRASVNDCSATRYSMTYATVVGTHDRSSAFVYGAVCCVCACRREREVSEWKQQHQQHLRCKPGK